MKRRTPRLPVKPLRLCEECLKRPSTLSPEVARPMLRALNLLWSAYRAASDLCMRAQVAHSDFHHPLAEQDSAVCAAWCDVLRVLRAAGWHECYDCDRLAAVQAIGDFLAWGAAAAPLRCERCGRSSEWTVCGDCMEVAAAKDAS